MRAIRRSLQVVALVGTILVGLVAVALIVSQTPWFRDWLRRYVVRESKQYLNGELSIGRLDGNLLFGVQLSDVAVDVSGERVVALKDVEVDYNVFQIVSQGIVLDRIHLDQPRFELERNAEGWNIGRLVKEQRQEADREGPGRPVSLQSIVITDGAVRVDDRVGTSGYRLPAQIRDLDITASFEYAPVHYTVDVDHVSFATASPGISVEKLSGAVSVRDDNLYVDRLALRTGQSAVTLDGVIEQYLKAPIVKVTARGNLSLPEVARVVPAAGGYALNPAFDVKASGPAERLGLTLDVTSGAGRVTGTVTADVKAPDFGVSGDVDVRQLDLAPILKDPEQKTDVTGHAALDMRFASTPASAPAIQRMSGTYRFTGPRVTAAGYTASDVRATGRIADGRVTIDARANAYGGSAAAKGTLVPAAGERPFAFDLQGQADDVNLKGLPASTGAPALETDLSVASFQVRGHGQTIEGSATLKRSTVEGATVADGTVAQFARQNGAVSYAARGAIADLNVQRLGRGLKIAALDRPAYDSRVNARFDVSGAGTTLESMTLDATGTLTDSTAMGARVPSLDFEAHIADGALQAHADGAFEQVDPSRVSGRQDLAGQLSGSTNVTVRIADLTAPVTPEAIDAEGTIALGPSSVGGLSISSAGIEGKYANQVGSLTRLDIDGPDLKVNASGQVALNRDDQSNLKYHVEAVDLATLGRLAGQQGLAGSAVLDGTVAGNRASLTTTGTLDGSGVAYQANNALDLNSTYTVTVPELRFADATVEATTTAGFLKAGGLEINELRATTTYADKRLAFTTNVKEKTRELDAKGDVIFHPDHQEIHLPDLAIRTEGIEWRTAPGSEPAIQYGGGEVRLENVRLVSGSQSIAATGSFPLDEHGAPGKLEVELRQVDLAQAQQLALVDRGLSGTLSGEATISGTATAPIVEGHVEVTNGGFQSYRYESLKAGVDYQGDRIRIDAALQQSPTETITARGVVPTSLFSRSGRGHVPAHDTDTVDLRIRSSALNLGVVQGFTTAITNVTGTLEADVRVTGSGEDPHLEGYVDIKGGGFGVPAGGVTYSGLTTRIDLSPDVVRIQRFQITDEEGESMTVSGQLAVHEKQVGAVNISIDSDNFEVIDNELGDVGVDAKLAITGQLRRPRIEGEVRLEAARIEVDRVLQRFYDPYSVEALPEVVSAERQVEGAGSARQATEQALRRAQTSAAPPGAEAQAAAAPPPPAGAFDPVTLDVRLRIPENLVLRGTDLRPGGPTGAALGDMNITVGGDIRVRKDPGGQVLLLGSVDTVRGTYEFQGRRFDLVRGGTVRFIGEPQINPTLDINATRDIPNTGVQAKIHITGTAKAPQLQLSSTPPLEESDILALIVFNRPVNELGTGERASLAATAGGIATGFIAAPLGESIGRALDLDLFEITTTTEEGDLGAGVTLGQQIGDRAFFKLRQQFGARSVSEFLIEYQLADFLRLQASAAPETTGSANRIGQRRVERAGIDLIFFFSY